MAKCGYCGLESADEHNFCEHCFKQVRCTGSDCGALLKPEAPICLKCGRQPGVLPPPGPAMNEYVEERTANGDYHQSIRASDAAAGALLQIMSERGAFTRASLPPAAAHDVDQDMTVLPAESSQEWIAAEDLESRQGHLAPPKTQGDGELRRRVDRQFHVQQDGKLIARTKDFKGKTKKDQQVRLILLCGLAYRELNGISVPARDHFNVMAAKAALKDNSFRTVLTETLKGSFNADGDEYFLTTDGENRAIAILSDMEDSSLQGWTKDTARSIGGGKRGPLSRNDAGEVDAWTAENVDAGSIDIRTLDTARTCAMFALWAITKHLRKAEAVRPKIAYAFMKRKYTTISVSSAAFKDALSAKSGQKYFKGIGDGSYFLTPAGEARVGAWRSTGRIEFPKHEMGEDE